MPLGRIAGAHGVRGWLRVESWTRPREAILGYRRWWLDGPGVSPHAVAVLGGRSDGRRVVARVDGCDSRDEALARRGWRIAVARDDLPAPAPGEYYWCDLEGLAVVNADGVALGRVARLLETGANDVLVVEGERERLIPFVPGRYVRKVDLEAGRIEVDWDAED